MYPQGYTHRAPPRLYDQKKDPQRCGPEFKSYKKDPLGAGLKNSASKDYVLFMVDHSIRIDYAMMMEFFVQIR